MNQTKKRPLILLSLRWYDARIHHGVMAYAQKKGWDVIANPHTSEPVHLPGADGQIVMIGDQDIQREEFTTTSGIPAVDLGGFSTAGLPRILPDNSLAGKLAAQEFLSRGFKHFAVFSSHEHWFVGPRRNGFTETIEAEGLKVNNWHWPHTNLLRGEDGLVEKGRGDIKQLITDAVKPIAVYAIEDEGSALLARLCRQAGISIPEEIALAGTNNDPFICPYSDPPLSSVDLDWEGIGYRAAERLDAIMNNHTWTKPDLVPPRGVEVRKSSDTRAFEDLRVTRAINFIRNNSHRHITVSEVGEQQDMPLRTLQWAFKKATSHSIQDEINHQRAHLVAEQLENPERLVSHIAEELGFSSAEYMNHFFTKQKGCSPSEYRAQLEPST